MTDDACKSLLEAAAKNGQLHPGFGRPARNNSDYDVGIICGARRHLVVRALGIQLVIEVRELADTQACVAIYEDNLLILVFAEIRDALRMTTALAHRYSDSAWNSSIAASGV